jgi:hypothetical protein
VIRAKAIMRFAEHVIDHGDGGASRGIVSTFKE